MKNRKVYLAGSISGRSYDSIVTDYREKANYLEKLGYETFCPMTGKGYLRNEIKLKAHDYTHPASTNHAIYNRDKWMVQTVDIVLADLSHSKETVSIGTMMEIAWASMLGKHVVTVMPKGNIHNHAFVYEASDIVFETLKEALLYLADIVRDF